jgi:integrase
MPRTVAKLKPAKKPYYVTDTVRPGLQLRVAIDGSRSWSVRYRMGRRMRRLTLGDAKTLDLAEARTRARDAMKLVSAGIDPQQQKVDARTADTVAEFAERYINEHARPKLRRWRDVESRLKSEVLSEWRHRPMTAIAPRDVTALVDAIAARPAPILANRVRALLSKFFKVAVQKFVVEHNPVADTAKPGVERIRERVLSDDELRTFWKTTEPLAPALRALWRVRLLTAKRPGEVANMRWQDVDLKTAWWVNPGEFEKNKLTHRVPLSASVVKLLKEIRGTATEGYIFVGVRGKKQRRVAFPLPDFQPKDLRKTAATYMSKHGVSDATIDAVLNHKKVGIIRVYNLYQYDNEKRVALDQWARVLTAIIKKKDTNVVAFARS